MHLKSIPNTYKNCTTPFSIVKLAKESAAISSFTFSTSFTSVEACSFYFTFLFFGKFRGLSVVLKNASFTVSPILSHFNFLEFHLKNNLVVFVDDVFSLLELPFDN